MKKIIHHLPIAIILFFILHSSVFTAVAQYPSRYFIQFTDKGNNTYTLSHPDSFLTARAIQRRTNQGIGYDSLDLPVTQAYIDTIAAMGATIYYSSRWLNGLVIGTLDTNLRDSILNLPFVVNANNAIYRKKEAHKDIEPYDFIKQEGLLPVPPKNSLREKSDQALLYGFGLTQVQLIHIDFLHNLGYLGDGKVICQLDAGYQNANVRTVFDSARNNNQFLGVKNFVPTDNPDVYNNGQQHGAWCLSTYAANMPGQLVGTAPHVSFWLLVTEDGSTENIVEEYNWIAGAEFADSVGADIITSSLIYTQFDHTDQNHTYADMNGHTTPASRGATIAHRKGLLVCNANGNYGSSSWHYLGTPADADSILAVGATDGNGNWVSFSSLGPSSDGRVKPDVADMGSGSAIARTDADSITTGSGTSFATPELAGAVACLWQAYPNFTNYEIRQAVIQCASQYNNPDTLLGYGVPNFECSYSILTGMAQAKNHVFVGIFPNPFNTSANLTINGAVNNLNATIHIYNVLGQEVKSIYMGNKINTILTRDNLTNGMYFYKLTQNNNQTVATGKFIVE